MPVYPPQYDAFFHSDTLGITSAVDVLGIGGDAYLSAKDGTRLVRYVPYTTKSVLFNASGKVLNVMINLRFPQVYKSGTGRPLLRAGWSGVSNTYSQWNSEAKVNGGASGKGYTYHATFTIQPEGHYSLYWENLNESATMQPTDATMAISDDSASLALTGITTRDEVGDSITSSPPVQLYVRPPPVMWQGSAVTGDFAAFSRSVSFLPEGVAYNSGIFKNVANTSINTLYFSMNYNGSLTNYGYDGNASGSYDFQSSGMLMSMVPFGVGATFTPRGTPGGTITGILTFSDNMIGKRFGDVV